MCMPYEGTFSLSQDIRMDKVSSQSPIDSHDIAVRHSSKLQCKVAIVCDCVLSSHHKTVSIIDPL